MVKTGTEYFVYLWKEIIFHFHLMHNVRCCITSKMICLLETSNIYNLMSFVALKLFHFVPYGEVLANKGVFTALLNMSCFICLRGFSFDLQLKVFFSISETAE